MATPFSSAALGGAIRDTEEYAAAFDLEVWKAQQQLRYQAQLRQAKENLERHLRTQMRETEQKKLAELEALRQELEAMGRRLQLAEETLEKRSAQLDMREEAFNAKRLRVAEQHEAYVEKAEERERRTREEAQLTQSSLQARLQEKDGCITQLQERLAAAQSEYDLLRRRASRYLTEQTDTDGQRLREQECAFALAQMQLAEVQHLLRDKTVEAERLAEDKVRLQGQLRETAQQLNVITRKYYRLREESQTREWERLRKEQDALDAAKRAQAIHARRGQALQNAPVPSSLNIGSGTVGQMEGGDEFYNMLSTLKQEVNADIAAVEKGNNSSGRGPHFLPLKIAEKLPVKGTATNSSTANARRSNHQEKSGTSSMIAYNSTVPVAAANATAANKHDISFTDGDAPDGTPYAESEIAKDETSSVSAALSVIHGAQSVPAQASSISPAPLVGNSRVTRGDVLVDMGDTSIESYYPRAQLQSWTNSFMMDGDDAHAVDPLPPARAGTLPPLAPELRGLYGDNGSKVEDTGRDAAHSSRTRVSPTPEDFVLSREVPLTDASSKTQAARRDMKNFVLQLKVNRERLLETGVYSEQDDVVREMGEKIRMYEEYLSEHP